MKVFDCLAERIHKRTRLTKLDSASWELERYIEITILLANNYDAMEV